MFVQKHIIFLQGSNKVRGWCNPDPSSPRVWAMAEQFPCSCQSDAPHCSVVFIADETAPCHWPLSSLMGAKAVSQESTSKTHTNAQACTHTQTFIFSNGPEEWLMVSLVLGNREQVKTIAGSFFLAVHRHWGRMGKDWLQMFIMWKATWSAIRILARDLIHVIILSHRSFIIHLMQTHTHTCTCKCWSLSSNPTSPCHSNQNLLEEIFHLLFREANYTIIKTDQNLFIPAHCPHCYGNSAKSSHLILAE